MIKPPGDYGVPVTDDSTAGAPTFARRRRLWVIGCVAAVAVALAATTATYLVTRQETFDVTGVLRLRDAETVKAGCQGQGGFSDLNGNAQVVVTDAAGTTIALGRIVKSTTDGRTCDYTFTVEAVPAGHGFYGVEVTRRGRIQYTEQQLRQGVTMSLGL